MLRATVGAGNRPDINRVRVADIYFGECLRSFDHL